MGGAYIQGYLLTQNRASLEVSKGHFARAYVESGGSCPWCLPPGSYLYEQTYNIVVFTVSITQIVKKRLALFLRPIALKNIEMHTMHSPNPPFMSTASLLHKQ